MIRSSAAARWFVLLASLGAAACSSGETEAPAQVSESTCESWRGALCDAYDRCDWDAGVPCRDLLATVSCRAGSEAEACVSRLEVTDCTEPPSGCGLVAVADFDYGEAECEKLIGSACDAFVRCGRFADVAGCTDHFRNDLHYYCEDTVGVDPRIDECGPAFDSWSCSGDWPASCPALPFYFVQRVVAG